uniref:S8 family serine peptidase n=1 Tax=Pseudonocardia pini TaxID=2758030 RepID=UPI0015F02211
MRADAAAAARIAASPGVRSIRRIPDARPSNASAAQLGRTLQTWQDTGRLGTGVRIGIIDTGVDYTHADFGGPGTVQAYDEARAGRGTFPTAKVVGGVDLAGDDYDSASDQPSRTLPRPDADPLDCEGHGTHVAGTAAGFGVNPDGTTFTGDYSALTPAALTAMRIGLGAAPRAELFAIRVFGCEGATALTPLALDRALDPDGDGDPSDRLDVVNLSLGSDYAPADDPVNDFVAKLLDAGVT